MFPKRFRDPKTGFHMLSSMHAKKYLKNIGLETEDYFFLKRVGTVLLCTYTVLGALWLSKDTSSLGWSKLKPRLKEHEEALKDFIAKGRLIATNFGQKEMVKSDKDFDQEAHELWLRMKKEVVAELKDKGLDVE
ncbi:hypothetical protein RJT34_12682 [Clitoria ternatea]|uniref:Uncharacterized protein n=1 Tax=Clitoria ternatea TaxID=43366 RepID=A0AAN9PKR2_CLITE